ncbi:MAG: hypothetical protein EOP06_05630 [Proteobacteria bacterium]|nr:MAG: hypothetical protein EOP06_05630 [Pseudomonadota bacterium]
MRNTLIFVIPILCLATSSTAIANCAAPVATAGTMQWIPASSEVQYCDGIAWKTSASEVTANACTIAGRTEYRAGQFEFCNGSFWVSMRGGVLDTCPSTASGTLLYDQPAGYLKWCNGANWHRVGARVNGSVTIGYGANNVADQTSYSFGGASIGTPAVDRQVIVGIAARAAAVQTISSVSVAGISALHLRTSTNSNSIYSYWIAPVPAGTTATVDIAFNGTMVRAAIRLWTANNLISIIPVEEYSIRGGVAQLINPPAGSFSIGALYSGNLHATINWTGLTRRSTSAFDDGGVSAAVGHASMESVTAQSGLSVSTSSSAGWSNDTGLILTFR